MLVGNAVEHVDDRWHRYDSTSSNMWAAGEPCMLHSFKLPLSQVLATLLGKGGVMLLANLAPGVPLTFYVRKGKPLQAPDNPKRVQRSFCLQCVHHMNPIRRVTPALCAASARNESITAVAQENGLIW